MTCVEEHYTTAITQETEGRHAGERSRTFTGLRPTDFESAASAIPPLRRLGANLSDRDGYCKTATVADSVVTSVAFRPRWRRLESDAGEHFVEGGLQLIEVSLRSDEDESDGFSAAAGYGHKPIPFGLRFPVLAGHGRNGRKLKAACRHTGDRTRIY